MTNDKELIKKQEKVIEIQKELIKMLQGHIETIAYYWQLEIFSK